MIVIISFSYSYLISKYPVAGGEFVYADTVFGKTHAFICGWFLALAYWALIPMNGTAVGLVARYIFPGPLQAWPLYEIAGWTVYGGELFVAILAIVLVGLINMRGVEAASWFGTAVALGLCGAMCIIAAVILAGGVEWSNLMPLFAPDKSALASIFAVAALAPWAFVGFGCIPQASEEYSFSNKKTGHAARQLDQRVGVYVHDHEHRDCGCGAMAAIHRRQQRLANWRGCAGADRSARWG